MWELVSQPELLWKPEDEGRTWFVFEEHDRAQDWAGEHRDMGLLKPTRTTIMFEEGLEHTVMHFVWAGDFLDAVFSNKHDAAAWLRVYADRLRGICGPHGEVRVEEVQLPEPWTPGASSPPKRTAWERLNDES